MIYDDLKAAEALRDTGMAQTTEAADPRIILAIDAAIDRLNQAGRPWSANDLRDSLPVAHGPLVGARVRAAATRRPREMVRVGYVPSTLPSTRAHPIAQWIGADSIEMAS